MEEQKEDRELSWETARVVVGRLIGINRSANEITIETRGEDGELFEEDYDLPEDFEKDQIEGLLDYLGLDVRVILLDNTVIKIARDGQLG